MPPSVNGSGPRGLLGLTRLLTELCAKDCTKNGHCILHSGARNFAIRVMMAWKAKKQVMCQFCLAQTSPSVTFVLTPKHLRSALGNLIMCLG
jgi:hypothetical protein